MQARHVIRLLCILGLLGPTALSAEAEKSRFPVESIQRVRVQQGNGDLAVRATSSDTATVTFTKIEFDANACELTATVKDGTLLVVQKDKDKSDDQACEVDLDVELPAAVAAELTIGAGDLDVTGLSGHLIYKIGAGDVFVKSDELKSLEGQSGTGKVAIDSQIQDTTLKIGAGEASIRLTKAPNKGKLDLHIGTGDAVVLLPKDAKVETRFRSGVGSLTNEIGDTKGAGFTVSGAAGVGDLTVKKL